MPNVPNEEVPGPNCIREARAPNGEGGLDAVSKVIVLTDPQVGSVVDVPQPTSPF